MRLRLLFCGIVLAAIAVAAETAPAKLFAVRISTGPAWVAAKPAAEQLHFQEHSANLGRLRTEGVLILGGRFAELGLLVIRAPDEAAARAQFARDPSIAAGIFKVQIDEYRPFFHGTTAVLATPEAVVLRAYLDAYNAHETDAVVAFCAETFKWFSIDGDKSSLDVVGRAPLREWLVGYFKTFPTTHSDFLSVEQNGPFLTVLERASWDNKAGKRVSQQSFGVYEIRDGLIQRVWYYPSVRGAPPAEKK